LLFLLVPKHCHQILFGFQTIDHIWRTYHRLIGLVIFLEPNYKINETCFS